MSAKHTPDSWTASIDPQNPGIVRFSDGDSMAGALVGMRARRIVAAVNSVAGIPTEALEAGVVGDMVEALEALVDPLMRAIEAGYYEGIAEANSAKSVLAKAKGESP